MKKLTRESTIADLVEALREKRTEIPDEERGAPSRRLSLTRAANILHERLNPGNLSSPLTGLPGGGDGGRIEFPNVGSIMTLERRRQLGLGRVGMEEVGKLLYENGLEADWFNPKLYASSSMEASLINAKQAPAFTERVGGHSSSNPTNHDKKRANLFSIIDEELPPLFNARVEGISNPQERLEWKAKYDKLAYALADYERPASGAVKAKLGATLREAEFAFGEESKAARMAVENIVDSAIKKAFGRSR